MSPGRIIVVVTASIVVGGTILLYLAIGWLFNPAAHAEGVFHPKQFVPLQPTAAQIAACAPDAIRLCGDELADHDKVHACMVRHKRQISQDCRDAFQK